jgi:hypothetical protein
MKRLVIILLIGLLSFPVIAADSNEIPPTVKLNIISPLKTFENGDKIEITGKGFADEDEIIAIGLDVYNNNGSSDLKRLQENNLIIGSDGKLSGWVLLEGIDVDDLFGQISIFCRKSNIIPTNRFEVTGDLKPFFNPLTEGTSFDFTEANANNIVELGELLTISASSSDWTGVLASRRNEYSDAAGTVLVTFVNLGIGSLTTNPPPPGPGVLTGSVNNSSTPYNASTVSMRLRVIDDDFSSPTSTTVYSVIDTDPPDLVSAFAFALDTVRLVFNESVLKIDGRDAATKFTLGGTVAPSITIDSLYPVGGDTIETWNLLISGLTDRGVGDLTIAYDSTLTPADSGLEDEAGNHVKNTSPALTVEDSIVPGVTALRDSSDTGALTIGEFFGNSTYKLVAKVTGGNSDTSLDSVVFEGSDNGSDWVVIGSDDTPTADGSDSNFEWTWDTADPDSQFRILRARAFDTNDNVTNSTNVGSATDGFNDNFKDTYRAIIEQVIPGSIPQSSGTQRAAIIVELQNNYGDSVNTLPASKSFTVSESSTTTELWWDVSTGGSGVSTSITLTINTSAGEDTVWYSNSVAGGPNTLGLVEIGNDFTNNNGVVTANDQTVSVTIAQIVNVSNATPSVDSNVDTTGSAGDLGLQATVDGGEDTGDDFRFLWGFSNISNPTPAQISLIDTSTNLTPPAGGGTIQYNVPQDSLQNLGSSFYYLFYWVDNVTTTPDSTILDGFPIKTSPARLILNPELVTAAGDNGADVRGGPFEIGVNNQEIVSIKFTTDPAEATIKVGGLVFDLSPTSTVDVNDIAAFHLYNDRGVIGVYEPAFDALLDDVVPTGAFGSVNFNDLIPVLNVTGTGAHVLVTVDILTTADPGHQLGMILSGPPQINFASAAQVVNGPNSSLNKRDFSDIGTSQDYSLPVDLVSFNAIGKSGKVLLTWQTASEINNAGFEVYRSDTEEGVYQKLNQELIPGNGNSNTAQSYSFEDKDVQEQQTYYYKLYSRDFDGTVHNFGQIVSATVQPLPRTFSVAQNYPNPFNPTTRISFDVAQESSISLVVYNMLGQKIRTLIDNQRYQPGVYSEFSWDAKDDLGNTVANGIYYLVFSANDYDYRQVRKMVFMK